VDVANSDQILRSLWRGHVNALGCFDANLTGEVFDRLCASYSELHRAYHTLEHLTQLFAQLERHGAGAKEPLRLAFSVWYHDVVYDPRANDNEEGSAARADNELKQLGAEDGFTARVARLILATKSHAKGGADADDDRLLDADYSILGVEGAAYKIYAAQIRREYAHLTDEQWRQGRGAFLNAAITQPRIFLTEIFETAYGPQARANMAAELAALEP
jgi:predicted metal-dependent HD superfamily phosphohydrolase